MIARRDIQLFLVFIIVGPVVAGAVFLMLAFSLIGSFALADLPNLIAPSMYPYFLLAAYAEGLMPAALNAVLTSVASRFIARKWTRVALAPLVGAVSVAICFVCFPWLWSDLKLDYVLLFLSCGAVMSFVCTALIEWLGSPLPAPDAKTG